MSVIQGKTIRVPMGKNNQLNQAEILKKTNAIFDILEQNSLLTLKGRHLGSYELMAKKATVQKINTVLGIKQKVTDASINNSKFPLMYAKNGDTTSLWVDERTRTATTHTALIRTAGNYEFQMDEKGMGTNKSEYNSFRLAKDHASLHGGSDAHAVDMVWTNNALTLNAKWQPYGATNWNTLSINGPLSLMNADLSFLFNGKDAGHAKVHFENNMCTFDISVLGSYEGDYRVDLIGKKLIEFGTFPVTKPTIFIEESDIPNASD